jgi:hypothetical protein
LTPLSYITEVSIIFNWMNVINNKISVGCGVLRRCRFCFVIMFVVLFFGVEVIVAREEQKYLQNVRGKI